MEWRCPNNEKADGTRNTVGELPENCLYESEYRDMPAEKIYAQIYKPVSQNENKSDDSGNPNNQNGDGQGNNNSPLDSAGNTIDIDIHMPILDDATKSEVITKIADILGGQTSGTGSSAIDRALAIAYKPLPFNWRRALTKYIRNYMQDNYTWNKPSRAGIANNVILPSINRTPKIHLAVAIDTSGSVSSNELNVMMRHLYTILQQFKAFTIDVWCCSTVVHKNTFRTYTAENKDEIADFKFESNGGTNMSANFEFFNQHYTTDKPDILLIISDFYDDLDGDTNTVFNYPVVGLIIDHPNFVPPSRIKFTAIPFDVRTVEKE